MAHLKNFLSGERLNTNAPPPYLLHLRSSKFFIISTVCIAVFTDMFLYAIIVPVIPFALTSRASVPQHAVQSWTSILLAVYGAALLVLSPVSGWFADKSSSRRLPLLIGLFALAGATLMLCLARTVALLVIGRLLQGFSAAIVWSVGIALLVDTVGQRDIGQTLGWVSLSMSVSILLGPLLGGIVYNKAGYYAVYYMAFALIALDILFRLTLIEKKIAKQWVVEASLDTEAISGQDRASASDLDHPTQAKQASDPDNGSYVNEPRPTSKSSRWPPVITLLSSRRLLAALWGCIVQASLLTAFDSVIPLYVQDTFHWDSIGAGLTFLALMIPNFLSPVVGWISDHYGPRWLAVSGFILALPFWILLRLVSHDTLGQKILLCALLALIGISLTLVMGPLMAEVTYVVEAKEKQEPGRYGKNGAYAQAYGLFITAFATGTLLGPIWAGYVRDTAGWGTMAWSLGLFSLAGAIPCLIWTGGLISRSNAKSGDERAIHEPKTARILEQKTTRNVSV